MPAAASANRGMGSVGSNVTTVLPEVEPTLSERDQLKIEFYKTYDVMTGVRIAATLGGFFTLMILLVVYKSRCKSNKQLEDPRLTAAALAAVAEAEAEERALAKALEAIARIPPRPDRGPRRSLCVEANHLHTAVAVPRFASVGGGYDALLSPPLRSSLAPPLRSKENRRCSSVTCSSTASGYLERRGSSMPIPCLPLATPTTTQNHASYEPWDLYYPIDIQVIQPTPELSPCGSEVGLYLKEPQPASRVCGPRFPEKSRRAPLASMGSVDPPEPDSRSLGSDSVFLNEEEEDDDEDCLDTEDEVSGFSTDSEAPGPSRFLRVPSSIRKKQIDKWDGCSGCVPRRRDSRKCDTCVSISATVEPSNGTGPTRTSSGSSQSTGPSSPPSSPAIELRHRPPAASLSTTPPVWSQETLF